MIGRDIAAGPVAPGPRRSAGSRPTVPVGHRRPKAGEVSQEQQQLSDPDKKMKELDSAR
jgi:hypothetical protein